MNQATKETEILPGAKLIVFILTIYSALIDLPSRFTISTYKLSAILTILVSLSVLLLLANIWVFQNLNKVLPARTDSFRLPKIFLVYGIFVIGVITSFKSNFNTNTIQNLACYLIVVSSFFLGSKMALITPKYSLLRLLQLAFLISSCIYLLSCLLFGAGNSVIFFPRAISMISCLAIAITFMRQDSARFLKILYLGIFVTTVIASLSRTGILVAFLTLLIHAKIANKRTRVFSFILIPVLFVVGRFIYSLPLLQARFGFVGDGAVVGGVRINTAGRFNIWKLLLERASDSPWIGHGIGASEDLVIGYFGTVAQPHNDFLRIYFDFGIVALFFWIFMCIKLGMRGFRSKSASDVIRLNFDFKYLLLLQLSIFMTTDNPLVYPFYVLPVFFLLGCCNVLVTPKIVSIK